jgi:regulatory protein
MTLTKISQQKRNLENVNLFLDDEFWCSISKDQLIEFGLHKGLKISENQKKEIEDASGLNKIKEAIIKYVSYRPRSKKEILDHLTIKKNYEKDSVENMIAKLEARDSGLIDDYAFARWFAENRMHHGTHGPQKIKAELFKKGIDSKVINKVIQELESKMEILDIRDQKIRDYVEKLTVKYQRTKNLTDFELRQKLSQALMRKGFNYDDYRNIFD